MLIYICCDSLPLNKHMVDINSQICFDIFILTVPMDSMYIYVWFQTLEYLLGICAHGVALVYIICTQSC